MSTNRRLLAMGAAVAAMSVVPTSAMAADSIITGVGSSDLSLSVPATVVSAGFLTPGYTTDFTPSPVAVVAPTGAWVLKVKDAINAGQLQKGGAANCDDSVATFAQPLKFTSEVLLGGTGVSSATAVSGTNVTVASGSTLLDTVHVAYKQAVGWDEAVAAGCNYATTLTYTVAAS